MSTQTPNLFANPLSSICRHDVNLRLLLLPSDREDKATNSIGARRHCSGTTSSTSRMKQRLIVGSSSSNQALVAAEIESTRKREEVIGLPFRIKDLQHNSVAQETWINHDPDNCVTRNILSHNTTPSPVSAVFNRAGRVGDQKGGLTNMNNKYSVIDFKSTSTCMLVMASIVDVLIQFRPLALISIVFAVTEEELIRKNPTVSTTCLEPKCWACDELKSQLCGLKDSSGSHDQVSCHWNIPQTGSGGNLRVPLPVLILIILLVCTPSIICFICSVWIWIKSVNNSGESPSSIPTVRTHDAAMGGPSRPDGRIQSHIIERENRRIRIHGRRLYLPSMSF